MFNLDMSLDSPIQSLSPIINNTIQSSEITFVLVGTDTAFPLVALKEINSYFIEITNLEFNIENVSIYESLTKSETLNLFNLDSDLINFKTFTKFKLFNVETVFNNINDVFFINLKNSILEINQNEIPFKINNNKIMFFQIANIKFESNLKEVQLYLTNLINLADEHYYKKRALCPLYSSIDFLKTCCKNINRDCFSEIDFIVTKMYWLPNLLLDYNVVSFKDLSTKLDLNYTDDNVRPDFFEYDKSFVAEYKLNNILNTDYKDIRNVIFIPIKMLEENDGKTGVGLLADQNCAYLIGIFKYEQEINICLLQKYNLQEKQSLCELFAFYLVYYGKNQKLFKKFIEKINLY
ncbi:hypothetical protein ABK040_013146 [Willaertia magna]